MHKYTLPFVSVIIPVYNVENYIFLCLHSVVLQTLGNIEIIVINDASTDNSLNIIEKFAAKDKRITVINNPKNLGLSAVRNIGLTLAKGEYIHFLDGDDYIVPYAYQELYEYSLLNQLDMLIFSHFRVKGNATKIYNLNYKLRMYGKKNFSTHTDKLLLLKSKIGVTVWNKLFRTKFLLDNKILFKEDCIFEDVLFFWQTITTAKNISFLNIPMYYYINRSDSIFNNTKVRKDLDIIKIINASYKFMLNNNYLNMYGKLFTDKVLKTYITFFKNIDKDKKKNFFKEMQKSLNSMELYKYIHNKKLKRKLMIMQNASFKLLNLFTKLKIIR